jgi:hypothetical protein
VPSDSNMRVAKSGDTAARNARTSASSRGNYPPDSPPGRRRVRRGRGRLAPGRRVGTMQGRKGTSGGIVQANHPTRDPWPSSGAAVRTPTPEGVVVWVWVVRGIGAVGFGYRLVWEPHFLSCFSKKIKNKKNKSMYATHRSPNLYSVLGTPSRLTRF